MYGPSLRRITAERGWMAAGWKIFYSDGYAYHNTESRRHIPRWSGHLMRCPGSRWNESKQIDDARHIGTASKRRFSVAELAGIKGKSLDYTAFSSSVAFAHDRRPGGPGLCAL
ncbi:hypothetical protein L249_5815, partial [Ophiocordyceps polyrhachis-furcata BCC 54312]